MEIKQHTEEDLKAVEGSFQPSGSRVGIIVDDFSYKGLLSIPEKYKTRPTIGTIVVMGPACQQAMEFGNYPDFYRVGDRVLMTMYSGTLVSIQNKPAYRVVEISELLGKIAKEDILEYTGA